MNNTVLLYEEISFWPEDVNFKLIDVVNNKVKSNQRNNQQL